MRIIPAIDLYEGTCVRLEQGDFSKRTVYSGAPAEVARSFVDAGLSFLHVVDLDGAKSGQVTNWDSLKAILGVPGVKVQVGGGVRSKEDIERLLTLGASRVVLGSIAVTLPSLVKKWIQEFGASLIAIALDVHNGKIAHSGWLAESEYTPNTFLLEMTGFKATTFICTDIERDGMLQGPNLELYAEIKRFFGGIELIACGGVTSAEDLRALKDLGVSGAIVGKALYEGKLRREDWEPLAT
jgi:phosphoribosylformimino-5-aminoimidazole carboxamide ribotide isomerase